ncbi:MAG: acyl-CoA dehydratase activase [Thermoplasmata archaeon]
MYFAGVDAGSTTTKAVVLDAKGDLVAKSLLPTGANVTRAAERSYEEVLERLGITENDVGYVIGTGYGRYKIDFGDDQVTEISCHAKGAHLLFPRTRTLVDIGGQDTKAIRLSEEGEVLDFCMNDKCAAGTGRFLENAASILDLSLDEIGPVSLRADAPIRLSNVCTVFVESEIIAHLARGRTIEDILRGVHTAVAARTIALVRRIGIDEEVTFTGGVSRNVGMVSALKERFGTEINVSELSQYMGCLGAALFALERGEGAEDLRARRVTVGDA